MKVLFIALINPFVSRNICNWEWVVDVDISIIHSLIKQNIYVYHNQTSSVNKFANKWINK